MQQKCSETRCRVGSQASGGFGEGSLECRIPQLRGFIYDARSSWL